MFVKVNKKPGIIVTVRPSTKRHNSQPEQHEDEDGPLSYEEIEIDEANPEDEKYDPTVSLLQCVWILQVSVIGLRLFICLINIRCTLPWNLHKNLYTGNVFQQTFKPKTFSFQFLVYFRVILF